MLEHVPAFCFTRDAYELFELARVGHGHQASSYRLLDAASSNTDQGIFTAEPEAIHKRSAAVAFAHEPVEKTDAPENQKTDLKQERQMQTKQSVTNLNNHQPSTTCGEKHAAMKLPMSLTVLAALGLLSTLLPVGQTAQAQDIPSRDSAPIVFQAAGATTDSIQSSVDAFRAALGIPNNGNNPGPVTHGRREINWDGGNPNVMDTTAPVTPFNVFLNTRGS